MFNAVTRAYFEELNRHRPSDESGWYAPWNMLLNELFPSAEGYAVRPQARLPDTAGNNQIPYFVLEVVKISTPPFDLRTVLIVEIKTLIAGLL